MRNQTRQRVWFSTIIGGALLATAAIYWMTNGGTDETERLTPPVNAGTLPPGASSQAALPGSLSIGPAHDLSAGMSAQSPGTAAR